MRQAANGPEQTLGYRSTTRPEPMHRKAGRRLGLVQRVEKPQPVQVGVVLAVEIEEPLAMREVERQFADVRSSATDALARRSWGHALGLSELSLDLAGQTGSKGAYDPLN